MRAIEPRGGPARQVNVKLSAEQDDALVRLADATGKSKSELIRGAIVGLIMAAPRVWADDPL